MNATCETIGFCTNTKKQNSCNANAPYICIYCKKHYCIDCVYIMCKKCSIPLTCFHCGFKNKNEIHYCNECNKL